MSLLRSAAILPLLAGCEAVKVDLGEDTASVVDTGSAIDDTDDTDDTAPADDDGDGYTSAEDCDDTDPDINPGSEEEAGDGLDNDCDGYTDEVAVCEGAKGDYTTIQDALEDAADGSTVLICAGFYQEDLVIAGKTLLVVGIDGAESTIIAPQSAGSPPMRIRAGAEVELQGLTLTGGEVISGGGLECSEATLTLIDSRITDNTASSNGGGLWYYSDGNISSNTFTANTASYNGGGAYFYYSGADIDSNTIEGNLSGGDGAGLFISYSSVNLSSNTFTSNESSDDGGGLRIYRGSDCNVESNEFYDNVAADDGGGAKLSHSEHTLTSNRFEGNIAGDAGGGVELDNDSSHVQDCTFVGNQAIRGAGLHSWRTEATFTIEDSVFEANIASDCGGALSFDNNPHWVTLQRLWLSGNEAVDGAGLCTDMVYRDPEDVGGLEDYYVNSYLRMASVAFVDNIASDDGGVMYIKAATASAQNITAHGNAGPDAAAVAVKGSTVTIVNAILSQNTGGPVLLVEDTDEDTASLTVSYSDLYDNDERPSGIPDPVGSSGNIDEDPDYTGIYELDSSSPCIDAGDPSIEDSDGSRSDMGYYGGPSAN